MTNSVENLRVLRINTVSAVPPLGSFRRLWRDITHGGDPTVGYFGFTVLVDENGVRQFESFTADPKGIDSKNLSPDRLITLRKSEWYAGATNIDNTDPNVKKAERKAGVLARRRVYERSSGYWPL